MADPYASGMSVLRAEVERQWSDTCRVTRPGELAQTPDLDDDGNIVAADAPVVYEGTFSLLDPSRLVGRTGTFADAAGVPYANAAKFPHHADLRPGDVVKVLTATYSPGLVGDELVVFGEDQRSFATHRRYLLRGSSWAPPLSSAFPAPTG